MVVVWQRILFQEVPGEMLMSGSVWELELRRWGLLGGPLVLVSWHWAYVGMSVGWEPGASLGGAVRGSSREDFIDGPLWVWRQCW